MSRPCIENSKKPIIMFQAPTNTPSPTPSSPEVSMKDVRVQTSRSGGAGGQHVNKVETRVTIFFDYLKSPLLTFEQKTTLTRSPEVRKRTNTDGEILVSAQEHRSQSQNRTAALLRLNALIKEALTPKNERKETAVPPEAHEHRLREKSFRRRKKEGRGRVSDE